MIDTSGDGILSKEELKKGCADLELRITDKEVELIFSEKDRKRLGTMDYGNFVEWMVEKNLDNKKDRMKCRVY